MIEEIKRDFAAFLRAENVNRDAVELFMDVSGYDLSDILYKSDVFPVFRAWYETGIAEPENIPGFDYSRLIKFSPAMYRNKPLQWFRRHCDFEILPVSGRGRPCKNNNVGRTCFYAEFSDAAGFLIYGIFSEASDGEILARFRKYKDGLLDDVHFFGKIEKEYSIENILNVVNSWTGRNYSAISFNN